MQVSGLGVSVIIDKRTQRKCTLNYVLLYLLVSTWHFPPAMWIVNATRITNAYAKQSTNHKYIWRLDAYWDTFIKWAGLCLLQYVLARERICQFERKIDLLERILDKNWKFWISRPESVPLFIHDHIISFIG